MADFRAALAEGHTLFEGTSRAFLLRRIDETAWKAARGWIVATLVALLAVGPATAAVSQPSPSPAPSASPALPAPSPSPSPDFVPEPTTVPEPVRTEPDLGDEATPVDKAGEDAVPDELVAVDEPAQEADLVIATDSTVTPMNVQNASGPWEYRIVSTAPAPPSAVGAGQEMTYTLSARRTGGVTGGTVSNAVVTFALAGDVSDIEVSGTSNANGQATVVGNTVTWSGMTLDRHWLNGNNTRTITVTATISPQAADGALTATMSHVGTVGTGIAPTTVSNQVAGVGAGDCRFADAQTGAFAQSICWFDTSDFDPIQARSGQALMTELPGGYQLYYTVTTADASSPIRTGSNAGFNIVTTATPTWSGAYFGNIEYSFSGNGNFRPALYQAAAADGSTSRIVLSNITLTHPDLEEGDPSPGFALVGADAESTNVNEWIQWTSDKPLVSIGNLGNNACGGALQILSATQVRCNGTGEGARDGAAILYSQNPTEFSQTMKGSGLQGVAFGVMVSGVRVTKTIDNPIFDTDQFEIVATNGGDEYGSAVTNADGFADTGQLHIIWSGGDVNVTLSEQPLPGTDAQNYLATWACYRNGEQFDPSGGETSKIVTVSFGDFVHCDITNTGPTLTLTKTVDNTAGGVLTPGDWTLTATNSGDTAVIDEAPSQNPLQEGAHASASSHKVSVPIGAYSLSELSSATGHQMYAPGAWECTSDGQDLPVTDHDIHIAKGAQVACEITNTYVATAAVSIIKQVEDTTGTQLADASGWELDATIASGSSSGVQISSGGSQTTAVDGTVPQPWLVRFANDQQSANIAISEQAQVGYVFVGAECTLTPVTGPVVTVAFSDAANAIVPNVKAGDQVECVVTNQQVPGTVTWTKVANDAEATLLAGSEWNLSGPGVPANTVVIDCTDEPCVGTGLTDGNAIAGQFQLADLAWGEYTLTESKAPAGYRLDADPITFTISAASLTAALGPVVNEQLAVPDLPLTGGLSTDLFLALGTGLMAAAGIGAWIYRRRSAAAFPH